MMNESPLRQSDVRFLTSRRRPNRFGWLGLPAALVLVVCAWASFFYFFPLLVNPWELIRRLEQQQLEPGTLATMAVAAQALMNVVFLLLVSMVLAILAWAWLERRYLRIVDRLLADRAAPPSPPATPGSAPEPPAPPPGRQ
jgi:hypothetical protein